MLQKHLSRITLTNELQDSKITHAVRVRCYEDEAGLSYGFQLVAAATVAMETNDASDA